MKKLNKYIYNKLNYLYIVYLKWIRIEKKLSVEGIPFFIYVIDFKNLMNEIGLMICEYLILRLFRTSGKSKRK